MYQFKEKNGNFYIEGDDRFYAHYLAKDFFVVYHWADYDYTESYLIFHTTSVEEANKLITEYIEENPNV